MLYPGLHLSHKAFLFPQPSPEKPHKLYMKVRWIPKSMMKDRDKSLEEKLVKGQLKILLMRGKKLGQNAEIKPYCRLSLQNRPEAEPFQAETKPVGPTQSPEFVQYFDVKVVFPLDGPKPPLRVSVVNSKFGPDAVIGEALIDLQKALDAPLKWSIDDDFEVLDKTGSPAGQIYLQVFFIPDSSPSTDPQVKPKDKDGKASLTEDDLIRGTLIARVVHAKELKPADGDTSDPYCIVNFPDGEALKTDPINKTINPIWNETLRKKMKVPIEKRDQNVKFVVSDSDFFRDDMLGQVDVDWRPCIEKPSTWAVNEIFKLTGTPDIMGKLSSLGYLYVQMQFVKDKEPEDANLPPALENLADILAKKNGIYKGNLRVFLISGRGLLKMDSDSSDPKVIFKVAGGKQVVSEIVKESLNPVWKKYYSIPVNIPRNVII